MSDFFPTATLETLRWRAEVLRTIREFFQASGYWEVETPLLSHDGPVDPHLDAFLLFAGGETLALQTSPEFGLKRLVSVGAGAIYQLGKSFRRGERGCRHNPEFTMLEWYREGDTYREQMKFVESLYWACREAPSTKRAMGAPCRRAEFRRTTYRNAFELHANLDPALASVPQLREAARSAGVADPGLPETDKDAWLNLLLAERVEPKLGRDGPEFLCDYPATQAALARVRWEEIPVAERFELYVDGIEICNGYTELTDPQEFEDRLARESARRQASGLPRLAESNRLLAAMRHGLPPCAGVALGVDRLLMVLGGFTTIDEVLAFPWERA